MKKISFLLLVVFLTSSCTKELVDNFVPKMSATIDGDEWSTITPAAVIKEGSIIITGISLSGKSIVITVFGTKEGTYTFSGNLVGFGAVYKESTSSTSSDGYIAFKGTVDITSLNSAKKRLDGSFSFSVSRSIGSSIEITDGVLDNIPYTEAK